MSVRMTNGKAFKLDHGRPSPIECRASQIKLLLMDCDGVLTDGRLWLLENGDEHKSFNTHDGLGLALLHRAGLKSGIITGRTSTGVERRASELGMEFVRQGDPEKLAAFEEVMRAAGVNEREVAYVGDDLTDIPLCAFRACCCSRRRG